ncbi:neurofilament heavy polypeptide-like [Mauremys mutica]|uniref:neurofilament heavy polypeptide-like n=1 Tax=Mauremys mutica TaxID=74926 RepID=UPI001D166C88|nr:neurofilament heavy polypeptide-like [Mauremys mutica]
MPCVLCFPSVPGSRSLCVSLPLPSSSSPSSPPSSSSSSPPRHQKPAGPGRKAPAKPAPKQQKRQQLMSTAPAYGKAPGGGKSPGKAPGNAKSPGNGKSPGNSKSPVNAKSPGNGKSPGNTKMAAAGKHPAVKNALGKAQTGGKAYAGAGAPRKHGNGYQQEAPSPPPAAPGEDKVLVEKYVTGEDTAVTGQEYEYVYKDFPEGAEPSELGPVLSAETPQNGGVTSCSE